MNIRIVFHTLGQIAILQSLLFVLPTIVGVIYKEESLWAILISMAISFVCGILLKLISKPKSKIMFAREGFAIVALAWIYMSAIGALPFVISGEIPSYIDAFFETVSGFTTTGASILDNVEALSHTMLFWRSFTHWVGGMGVLVFVMALMPSITDRSMHILRAEMPGPVIGKLVPRAKDTAIILYLIYIVMTVIEIILLLSGGMSVFDSLIHSFGTAGTGGFGLKPDSLASYSSYLQWVITIFMFLFALNFNLYFLLLVKKFKSVIRSSEMWCFACIVLVSTAIITANTYSMYNGLGDTVRYAAFQVSSIISTTGYSTTDFNTWPTLSKGILLILMMIGGCAGSTAGGLKLSRVMILFKSTVKELKRMLNPRSIRMVNIEGKPLENQTVSGVISYFAIYMVSLIAIFLLLCIEPFDLETNISAAIACFNNIGPGFSAVGPMASYSLYSDFSKLLLSFAMLLGRLEIFPLLLAFTPSIWKKRM